MNESNTTPNCEMHEALVSFLYNEATVEEGRRVEAHLEQCASCADALKAFGHVRSMLQKWQVDEMPEVYLVTKEQRSPRRSTLSILSELLSVAPWWVKSLGVAAAAILLLSVVGTNVSVGPNGFSFSTSLFRSQTQPQVAKTDETEQVRTELKAIVNSMIAESERQQADALKLQLVSVESQLQSAHEADLARLSARILQQREMIRTLERDIDRREGLALSDILFSEVTTRSGGSQGGE
ncbi:MAG TPA: zf-HC2 domain-containing protein [Blastocatellia bacterium]|nr:zf-HC2 domain-containing protein [Blastocatellia bacterium]